MTAPSQKKKNTCIPNLRFPAASEKAGGPAHGRKKEFRLNLNSPFLVTRKKKTHPPFSTDTLPSSTHSRIHAGTEASERSVFIAGIRTINWRSSLSSLRWNRLVTRQEGVTFHRRNILVHGSSRVTETPIDQKRRLFYFLLFVFFPRSKGRLLDLLEAEKKRSGGISHPRGFLSLSRIGFSDSSDSLVSQR